MIPYEEYLSGDIVYHTRCHTPYTLGTHRVPTHTNTSRENQHILAQGSPPKNPAASASTMRATAAIHRCPSPPRAPSHTLLDASDDQM